MFIKTDFCFYWFLIRVCQNRFLFRLVVDLCSSKQISVSIGMIQVRQNRFQFLLVVDPFSLKQISLSIGCWSVLVETDFSFYWLLIHVRQNRLLLISFSC